MVEKNDGQAKGAVRANEVRRAKTQAIVFYLRCLNAGANITEFYRYYHFKHLPYDYCHKMVRMFSNLPHQPDGFFEMMNSYRAKKVMLLLGENVNPKHLTYFSGHPYGGKLVVQDKKQGEFMFNTIQAHKREYKKALRLFIKAFVDDLKLGWKEMDMLAKENGQDDE